MSESVVKRHISIYPEDEAALIQAAKDNGLSGLSAAVRFVTRFYVRAQVRRMAVRVSPGLVEELEGADAL